MHTPLSDRYASDAKAFGLQLPTLTRHLGRVAPEPVTERLAGGILAYAEQSMGALVALKDGLTRRIADRSCPWLTRAIPAAVIVAFDPVPNAYVDLPALTELPGEAVDACTPLFRTLRPLRVGSYRVAGHSVAFHADRGAHLRIELVGPTGFAQHFGDELSIYIDGDREGALQLVHTVCSGVTRVHVESPHWSSPVELPSAQVVRGGLPASESLAPDPNGRPQSFGIITESIVFPDKFRFLLIEGMAGLREQPPTDSVTLVLELGNRAMGPSPTRGLTLRSHCVAVVSLFERTADPIPVDFTRNARRLQVAGLSPSTTNVYSVRDVHAIDRTTWEGARLRDNRRDGAEPVASTASAQYAVAYDERDAALKLHLAPLAGVAAPRGRFVVSTRVLATQRVRTLRAGEYRGRFTTSDVPLAFASISATSPFVAPPTGQAFRLRVLLEAAVRRDARGPLMSLRRTLALACPSWSLSTEGTAAYQQRLDAFHMFDVVPMRRRTPFGMTQLGYRYDLSLDESTFVGSGELALFGEVLAEALSRSTPLGAFLQLTVTGVRGGASFVYRKGSNRR